MGKAAQELVSRVRKCAKPLKGRVKVRSDLKYFEELVEGG
jgi:hypothetical protein